MSAAPARRDAAIDVLKGLAILGVMAQHALDNGLLYDIGADLHIRQAVPVLFVLMGYNAARSSLRRPETDLRTAYGRRYWEGRFDRILLPLVVVFAIALVVGALTGRLQLGPLTLIGALPVPGPGAYFVTILLVFTLIWPAWMHVFRRRPGLTVLAVIALDVAFELASGQVASFNDRPYPYLYDASIFRYGAAMAVGMWLAIDDEHTGRRRIVVLALVPLSLAFILTARADQDAYPLLVHGFTLTTGFAAVPWAVALMLGLLWLWPAQGIRGTGWLERLGIASYEVFLVQIVWFGVLPERGDVRYLADVVVCGLLGWALHRVLTPRAADIRHRLLAAAGRKPAAPARR